MKMPPIKFPAAKGKGIYCRNRAELLANRIGVKAKELTPRHRLCNVLAHVNRPLGKGKGQPGDFLDRDLPWLTLILGSGCSSESTEGAMWVSADSISAFLKDEASLPDKRRPDDVVRLFVQSLLRLRDPNIRQSPPDDVTHEGNWKRAARLLLVTALLTQLYHEAAAVLVRPLDQKASDRIFIQPGPQRRGEYIVRLAKPIKEYIGKLLHEEFLLDAVREVITKVDAQLGKDCDGYIDQLDIQILTEFSWLELTTWSTVYPGWSDLLADLVRQRESLLGDPPYVTPLRPRHRRELLLELISQTYMTVTQDSWRMRCEKVDTDRQKFFDSAARVLMTQARIKSQGTPQESPPFACVFSTSFDLELEMALASQEGFAGFIIALPIYLQSRSASKVGEDVDTATFSWIGAVIKPKNGATTIDLDDILTPQDENWISLSDPRVHDYKWPYAKLPFVVHLAGSPLITLPSVERATSILNDLPEAEEATHDRKPERVIHALLLDEYDAMQQHSSEIFAGGPGAEQPHALPGFLIGLGGEAVAEERYWMIMGVQMDDAAVRHRVASRLGVASAERLRRPEAPPSKRASSQDGKQDHSPEPPLTAGLVVVKRIGPAAQELLGWFGVDIVESESGCFGFKEDLDHYAEHLESGIRMSTDTLGCRPWK